MSSPQQNATETGAPVVGHQSELSGQAIPPSKVVEPTRVDDASQQASTSPGDGGEVRADQIRKSSEVNRDDPNVNVVEVPQRKPSFKEKVYGYAKVIRGTTLGNPNAKEEGQQVLRGEQTIPKRRGSAS
ncbi:hypothetical protein F5I97DRAFT_1928810 [Phlebopus sp. FC_14]|nr:hypothetical protein F5I97DRAFT_1928810 [Phlebopus sp. FC_14]